jgi:hypothetical protein
MQAGSPGKWFKYESNAASAGARGELRSLATLPRFAAKYNLMFSLSAYRLPTR